MIGCETPRITISEFHTQTSPRSDNSPGKNHTLQNDLQQRLLLALLDINKLQMMQRP